MRKEKLDGREFFNLFSYGANEVILNREKLNKINVFPVADGDTGNNLVSTLNSILDYTQVNDSFSETLNSMSEASLYGARGNSGVIFAQYISGLASQTKGKAYVKLKDFATASMESAHGLYSALSNPVEGTMLTVIKEWSLYINENHSKYEFFDEMFENSIEIASKSLEETKEQLEVLKKNNVVDSGGKGFVLFLEGVIKYLKGYSIENIKQTVSVGKSLEVKSHVSEEESYYRYCTECIIKGNIPSPEIIKEELNSLGDSIIVAGNESFKHIHIHTNQVEDFFSKVSKYGAISRPKVEDIHLQERLKVSKGKIAVVTDSIADIPKDILEKHDIHQIPLNILVGDNVYLDKTTIKSENFYNIINNSPIYPNSSQPNDIDIKNKIDFLKDNYESIVIISVSSKLSGTYDSLVKYSNVLKKSGYPIEVIDSKLNSVAQGLLVAEIAQMVEQGKNMEDILKSAQEIIPRTEIYVALDTFKNSLKSGRVPKIIGKIGVFFKLRPIISLDKEGKGAAFSIAISKKALMKKILDLVKSKNGEQKIFKYAVVHSGDEKNAKIFAKQVEEILGLKPEYICEISSITALHAGEKAVAIGFIR